MVQAGGGGEEGDVEGVGGAEGEVVAGGGEVEGGEGEGGDGVFEDLINMSAPGASNSE